MKVLAIIFLSALTSGCIPLIAAAVIDKQENTNRTKVQNEHEENMKALEIQERRMELENKRLSMPQPQSPALNPYLTKPDFN